MLDIPHEKDKEQQLSVSEGILSSKLNISMVLRKKADYQNDYQNSNYCNVLKTKDKYLTRLTL